MTITYSKMLPLGTHLPNFNLPNPINNKPFNSASLSCDKGKVIMFICNHCSYVIHAQKQIMQISNKYLPQIEFVAISSNDIKQYPDEWNREKNSLNGCF